MAIPVVDIFAGPGGLGEGFSAFIDEEKQQQFKIVLSIEKESEAHKTLTLRSFFRQFPTGEAPEEYYSFIKKDISRNDTSVEDLYSKYPAEANKAKEEAWQAELGKVLNEEVDLRIKKALKGEKNWLLIGGPPCQAYSIVGRSRRKEKILDATKDHRVELYKQYLRILAIHSPAVFVMENVKGILSAKTKESSIFGRILKDLSNPAEAFEGEGNFQNVKDRCKGYKIYSLVKKSSEFDLITENPFYNHNDFIIEAEKYGVPQTRHRVILLGIRNDIKFVPEILEMKGLVPLNRVINDLPKLRSGISTIKNEYENWIAAIKAINLKGEEAPSIKKVFKYIKEELEVLKSLKLGTGGNFISCKARENTFENGWFIDNRLMGVANHESRSHMNLDLHRYFYASCFAKIYNKSPKIKEFPVNLLPNHNNVNQAVLEKKFEDRFRVQLGDHPAKTITSHIAKDGHYYIHPDPKQCRTLTVREAARIQTFPDNYFFCGSRTAQYHQVGNAVPPFLAFQIAKIVKEVFENGQMVQNKTVSAELLEQV